MQTLNFAKFTFKSSIYSNIYIFICCFINLNSVRSYTLIIIFMHKYISIRDKIYGIFYN